MYIRVSRVGGRGVEAEGGTAAEQKERCLAQLKADGLKVGEVFSDLDESGAKISRPEFDKMLARVGNESGGVIVLNLSRFTRADNVVPAIVSIEEAGGVFISCEEKVDTSTAMGRAIVRFLGVLNTLKVEQSTEQWSRSIAGAAARGIYVGAIPTGYRKGADRVLQKVEDECEKIAAAFRVRAGGGSWSEVARALEGLRGKRWTTTAARNLLSSRVYLGILPGGNGGVYHPALQVVTREVWEAANKRELPRPGTDVVKGGRRDSGQRSFAAGILRCAGCGRALTLSITTKGGKEYAYFKCGSGSSYCTAKAICKADEAEALVARLTRELFAITEKEGNLITGEDADPAVVGQLEHERDQARAYVAELTAAVEHGDKVPVAALVGAQAALDTAEEALLEETGKRIVQVSMAEFTEAWEKGTVEERRALTRQMLTSVAVSRGKEPLDERVEVLP